MTRHPRTPALLAIVATAALGLSLMAATGQFRDHDLASASLDTLERQIVGCQDPAVWSAYADRLLDASRFTAAARAYDRAIALQPDAPHPRLGTALALARANNPDAFFTYFSRLTALYPKLAVDLLERPELAPLRADPRFDSAAMNARTQAID